MNVAMKVSLRGVNPFQWAENNNGPWPEANLTALQVAVRQDIRSYVRTLLQDGAPMFTDLEIEVEVQ